MKVETETAARQLEEVRMRREAETKAAAQREEQDRMRREARNRLEGFKTYGRDLAGRLPADWRARVTADLEAFVTPQRFPASLTIWEGQSFVRARVDRYLDRFDEIEHAKLDRANRQQRVEELIKKGMERARWETLSWGFVDAAEARREVGIALREEVRSEMSENDVLRIVDEVLDDYCAEDEDEQGEDD